MTLVGRETSSVSVAEHASAAALAPPARKPLLLAAVVACAVVITISLAARWDAIIAWVDLPVLLAATGRQFERLLPVTIPTVLAFAALLLLERVIPARRQQGTVSRGFCEDVLWVVLYGPMIIFGAFWFGRSARLALPEPARRCQRQPPGTPSLRRSRGDLLRVG